MCMSESAAMSASVESSSPVLSSSSSLSSSSASASTRPSVLAKSTQRVKSHVRWAHPTDDSSDDVIEIPAKRHRGASVVSPIPEADESYEHIFSSMPPRSTANPLERHDVFGAMPDDRDRALFTSGIVYAKTGLVAGAPEIMAAKTHARKTHFDVMATHIATARSSSSGRTKQQEIPDPTLLGEHMRFSAGFMYARHGIQPTEAELTAASDASNSGYFDRVGQHIREQREIRKRIEELRLASNKQAEEAKAAAEAASSAATAAATALVAASTAPVSTIAASSSDRQVEQVAAYVVQALTEETKTELPKDHTDDDFKASPSATETAENNDAGSRQAWQPPAEQHTGVSLLREAVVAVDINETTVGDSAPTTVQDELSLEAAQSRLIQLTNLRLVGGVFTASEVAGFLGELGTHQSVVQLVKNATPIEKATMFVICRDVVFSAGVGRQRALHVGSKYGLDVNVTNMNMYLRRDNHKFGSPHFRSETLARYLFLAALISTAE